MGLMAVPEGGALALTNLKVHTIWAVHPPVWPIATARGGLEAAVADQEVGAGGAGVASDVCGFQFHGALSVGQQELVEGVLGLLLLVWGMVGFTWGDGGEPRFQDQRKRGQHSGLMKAIGQDS